METLPRRYLECLALNIYFSEKNDTWNFYGIYNVIKTKQSFMLLLFINNLYNIGPCWINENIELKILTIFLAISLNICFECSKEQFHWVPATYVLDEI